MCTGCGPSCGFDFQILLLPHANELLCSHDWSDEYCVKILTGIRKAMSSSSRVLICDQVMNTTTGHPELTPAPAPLPSNYGEYMRPLHQLDMIMLAAHNGIERTPAEVDVLLEASGLKLKKIWECRSQLWIIEARLA